MSKIYLSSDFVFNKPDHVADYEMFGDTVIPVDMNGAHVPRQKDASDNLSKTQASIRRRFSLGE